MHGVCMSHACCMHGRMHGAYIYFNYPCRRPRLADGLNNTWSPEFVSGQDPVDSWAQPSAAQRFMDPHGDFVRNSRRCAVALQRGKEFINQAVRRLGLFDCFKCVIDVVAEPPKPPSHSNYPCMHAIGCRLVNHISARAPIFFFRKKSDDAKDERCQRLQPRSEKVSPNYASF